MNDNTGMSYRTLEAIQSVCIAAVTIVAIVGTLYFIEGLSERHNYAVSVEKQACIEKAETDLALLACREGLGQN